MFYGSMVEGSLKLSRLTFSPHHSELKYNMYRGQHCVYAMTVFQGIIPNCSPEHFKPFKHIRKDIAKNFCHYSENPQFVFV